MKSSAKKVELASVDDLFSTEESRADAQREKVLEIPLSELHPFKDHPFKVKDDEAMMETADSIRQYGMLSAVSNMASSSLTLKGWSLNGCSSDKGISRTFSRWASARLSSVENRSSTDASSTFFALLFKFQHLLCQIAVALGHLAAGVMGEDALALGADLLGPD